MRLQASTQTDPQDVRRPERGECHEYLTKFHGRAELPWKSAITDQLTQPSAAVPSGRCAKCAGTAATGGLAKDAAREAKPRREMLFAK